MSVRARFSASPSTTSWADAPALDPFALAREWRVAAGKGSPGIWDLIFSGEPMTGTAGDDFMFGYAVTSVLDNDIDGNLGDDLIIGDIGNFRTLSSAAANGSLASAFDLDSAVSAWTAGENALVMGSTVLPHITVYVEATAGDDEWFRFSIPTGTGPAAFYLDVDYGVSAIGISTDTVIELYDSSGLLLASNDTSAITNGGFGSTSDLDPFINYTELTGGTFYVRILETVTSTPNFEGGETFLLNISAGAHAVSVAAPAGDDTIDGDDNYEDTGQDEVFGGAGDDILRGGGGNDFLHGGSGADDLNGSAGNDVMDGGTGADYMNGTDGDDIYFVDNANDDIGENDVGGGGNDILYASVSYVLNNTFGVSVETLATTNQAGTGAINLTGNYYTNFFNPMRQVLHGNNGVNILRGEAGDDTLNGYGGADFLVGGEDEDIMNGGTGDDTYYVDDAVDTVNEAAGEGNDRIAASVSYILALSSEVELLGAITLSSTAAMDLTGSNTANRIDGNDGVNLLRGEGGNDLLYGHAGNDFLSGGAGVDFMAGGTGNDNFYVDDAADAIGESNNQGTDRIAASVSYILSNDANVELLEAVNAAATNAFDLTGSNSANTITGNDGVNILRGEAGNDTLSGAGGDDYLVGGTGEDGMIGSAGNDTYYVDNAADVCLDYAGEGTADRVVVSLSYQLVANAEIELLEPATQSLTIAIDLTGSDFANTIRGNDGVNIIDGKLGHDVLTGFGGADGFQFTTALGAGNIDTIADFAVGIDKIRIDNAVFAGLAPGALPAHAFVVDGPPQDLTDRILYNSQTGQLYYDADGNGAGAAVLFAILQGAPALPASDILVI